MACRRTPPAVIFPPAPLATTLALASDTRLATGLPSAVSHAPRVGDVISAVGPLLSASRVIRSSLPRLCPAPAGPLTPARNWAQRAVDFGLSGM